MLRATNKCRLYRTVINQFNWRHLLLMRNRHKILLRDYLVLEVYLKTCLQHYTVSDIPETHTTAQGPNRPHINGGGLNLKGICYTEVNRYFSFNLDCHICVKSCLEDKRSSLTFISKQILERKIIERAIIAIKITITHLIVLSESIIDCVHCT